MNNNHTEKKTNYNKLAEMSEMLRDRLTDLLDFFSIEYKEYANKVVMPCPVHNGDNKYGCVIYTKNEILHWVCNTHHCEKDYGKGIYSFIQGLLSNKDSKKVQMHEAIGFVEGFLGYTKECDFDESLKDKLDYNKSVNILNKERVLETGVKRENIVKNIVNIDNFLDKNISSDTLKKYDVFFCGNRYKPMYNRIVVPVYDDNYQYMIGCVGRTINPKCQKCNLFHVGKCPETDLERYNALKWVNSPGFSSENYMYNLWFAKEEIMKTNTVILVEGQADVWKIYESGFKNVLGMFGTELTEKRKIILETYGVLNIIVFTDPDKAGNLSYERIKSAVGSMYNIFRIISFKQPSELTNKQIQELINPILKRCAI